MKNLMHIRITPATIIGSVLFWALLYMAIYTFIFIYWLHKIFYAHDKNVNVYEGTGTAILHRSAKVVYRKELRFYWEQIKPFAKR